jgi:transposase
MIIHTNNFAGFQTTRPVAAYYGCAPFPNESGTIDKGSHISRLANRELKVLLSQCAVSAMQHNMCRPKKTLQIFLLCPA